MRLGKSQLYTFIFIGQQDIIMFILTLSAVTRKRGRSNSKFADKTLLVQIGDMNFVMEVKILQQRAKSCAYSSCFVH